MKNNHIFLLFCTVLALLFAGCQKEEVASAADGGFRLLIEPSSEGATRSTTTVGRVAFYLTDSEGRILPTPFAHLAPDLSYIRIEGLKNGDYRLIVLAESNDSNPEGVTISPLTALTQEWLRVSVSNEKIPNLKKEYFYADHPFHCADGKVSDSNVTLSRICGKVRVQINTHSDYASSGIFTKIEVIPSSGKVFSALTGEGTPCNAGMLEAQDVTGSLEFLSLPTNGAPMSGKVAIHAQALDGTPVISYFNFSVNIQPNRVSTIVIDYKHPDDESALLNVPYARYNGVNSFGILQDGESKDILYDEKQRSFNITKPLQYGFDADGKLFVRFYSAVGISNVKLWWTDGNEELEFARFDSIPPFFEAHIDHPITHRAGNFYTRDNRLVRRQALTDPQGAKLKLTVECDDPYWQKIQKITTDFLVKFRSYGGDPDAPDGGPAGNWMGLRPIHAREACALLTNMSYVLSSNDFEQMVNKNIAAYLDNDRKPLTVETVLKNYRSNRELRVGLIYGGNGVSGLAGGTIWGVEQWVFFGHYTGSSGIAWHEFSHCVGYKHESTMSYGQFAEVDCPGVYTRMCKSGEMPVYSAEILDSQNNPHRYN